MKFYLEWKLHPNIEELQKLIQSEELYDIQNHARPQYSVSSYSGLWLIFIRINHAYLLMFSNI